MVREERQNGAGSLWEGREKGVASGIFKVAGGRRDANFPTVENEADN